MISKNKLQKINYNETTLIFLFLYLGVTFFSVAISNICLGIACATFLLGLILKQISFKALNLKVYLAIITPFFLTILSALNSNTFDVGIGYLILRLPILVVSLILCSLTFKKEVLKKAFTLLLLAAILASLITFYNAIKYYNEDILFQTDFTYFITAIHHPYFGIYILIAILGMLEMNIITNSYFKFFAIVFLSLAISLTTSRIVYILYFLVALGYCYTKLPVKRLKYSIVIIGVLASLLIISNKDIFNKFSNTFSYNKSPRLKLWTNSLEAVNKTNSYILGIGIGDFYKEKKDAYFSKHYGNKTTGLYGYNPHSQLMEFYVTNGLFGVAIILLALGVYLLKLKNQNFFALSIFTIVFLFSLVECIFNRQYGVQLYCVIIPLIINQNFKEPR